MWALALDRQKTDKTINSAFSGPPNCEDRTLWGDVTRLSDTLGAKAYEIMISRYITDPQN